MTAITAFDPIFGNVAATTGTPFLDDVITLINESPNLVAEINAIDALPDIAGGQATIAIQQNNQESGSTIYRAPQINISALSSYDDSNKPYVGGSFTSNHDDMTPAAVFVGTLAHEGGHYLDAQIAPIYTAGQLPRYSLEQAVATELASEGKATYEQYLSKAQIDAANKGIGTGYFNAANTIQQDDDELRLVSHISDAGQAESYLGSHYWNVGVDGGTYLSTFWTEYGTAGAINYLGINQAAITNVTEKTDDSGTLTGSTIQSASLDYSFAYSAVGSETASVSNPSGTLLYTEVFTSSGTPAYSLARYQSGGFFSQSINASETVVGNHNSVTDAGGGLSLQGNDNSVIGTAQMSSDILTGSGDDLFDQAAAGSNRSVSLSGSNDTLVLGSASTTVTGAATGTDIFSGSGSLDYAADGGTLILGGAASITGAAANTIVFGGAGTISYTGANGDDDVISGIGSATIQAGSGGGWYQGGSNGNNLIFGSNSGVGTVLAAGGNGDTIQGGSSGGDFFLAGSGNETLLGGNSGGTQTIRLGSGADAVQTGTANSIIDTGTGSATINDFGSSIVYGGTGQSDVFTATAGHMDVVGFRAGTDHVSGSIATSSVQGSNTILQFSDGASITLLGVPTSVFT